MNRNYQKELDQILERITSVPAGNRVPTLFLHSCCAPCSSYVLEYLSSFFAITVFYFNPNISEAAEYEKRVAEQKRLIASMNEEAAQRYPIQIVEGTYEPADFFKAVKGYESCPEGGERCFRCYELRLAETIRLAEQGGFDYAATTLTISPLKNAARLNEIGERLTEGVSCQWLPSDFKKRNGYKRSVELSAQYGLYRQNYCGCVFSKAEAAERDKARAGVQECSTLCGTETHCGAGRP